MTIPPEVRADIREALGFNDPFLVRYGKWLRQMFVDEPLGLVEGALGIEIGGADRTRIISWASRAPVMVAASLGVAAAIITESALSFSGSRLPFRFPHLGTSPLRWQGLHPDRTDPKVRHR